MKKNVRAPFCLALVLLATFVLGGCATLAVTPKQALKPSKGVQPVNVGIRATGERLREAFSDPAESAVAAASGTLFRKVVLLPPGTGIKAPADGTDYVVNVSISDISVNGNLNPIWFASIPILFFKPFTPIVTFEAVVTLDTTLSDAHSGTVVAQRQVTETATDHFSPRNPQPKVRKLISLCINNALVTTLEEFQGKMAVEQPKPM